MKTNSIISQFGTVLIVIIFLGCSSANTSSATRDQPIKGYTTLLDMLREEPQLNISGSGSNPIIRIRGNRSLLANNEPLFVLDSTPLGNGYSSANSIDVNNVESIKVLTPSQSSLYGARGANGVVQITTKR